MALTVGEEGEAEAEEEVPALIRKKTKRGNRAETEQDAAVKRRMKEKARKVEHEQVKLPVEEVAEGGEENKAAVETELPVTPSIDVPEAITGSPVDVDEIGEPAERRGENVEQRPYALD